MRFEFEKDIRIMADLAVHCHRLGAKEYKMDMSCDGEVFTFCIRCKIKPLPQNDLEELETQLNRPRQREIEESYWGLTGEDSDSHLTLVGMMLDGADVRYSGGELTISARREA